MNDLSGARFVHHLCTNQGHSTRIKNAKWRIERDLANRVRIEGGEGGTRSGLFSQLRKWIQLGAQPLNLQWFYAMALLTVISGCLGTIGIGFRTKPVHRKYESAAMVVFSASSERRSSGKKSSADKSKSNTGPDPQRARIGASYSRFSSDQQNAKSIAQQQRACRKRAQAEGISIRQQFEFCDEAVSGAKRRRNGLDRLMAAAKLQLFGTLLFFDLSRLARELIISNGMLKQLVFGYKVRVISVKDGIDSAIQGWYALATLLGLMNEQFLQALSENVLRGLIDNVLDPTGLSVGDYCFGYRTEPIPGTEKQRSGRNSQPKKRYVIDDIAADWVRKIFHWFVKERQPLRWIVQELNRCGAPRDHRVKGRRWSRAGVIGVLRRSKYIGIWPWGEYRNVRDPLTGNISQEPRPADETKEWVRHLPYLMLVELETFEIAQDFLDENAKRCVDHRGSRGKLSGSSRDKSNPRHLLQGRIQCAECGSTFYVGGARGRYLVCPGFRDGICSCRTMLPRKLAERLILEQINHRILQNKDWRQAVLDSSLDTWNIFESTVPVELASVERQVAEIDQKIGTWLDRIERGLDDPDVKQRLADRRAEREDLELRLKRLKREADNRPPKPTIEWIDQQIAELHNTLASATPAAALALANLIGSVIVREEIRPGRKRPFLRGEFVLRAELPQKHSASSGQDNSNINFGETVILDFVEDDPRIALSETVKKLSDEGLGNWEIAKQLKLRPPRVTYYWTFWWKSRGLEVPDRRNRPKRKLKKAPLYQQLAEEAKRLWDVGDSEKKIARKLDTTDRTVRNAIQWWHESRGLPVPRFSDRRNELMQKVAELYHGGTTLDSIAKKFKRSVASICDLLDDWYAARGEMRPDGRSQRRRKAS